MPKKMLGGGDGTHQICLGWFYHRIVNERSEASIGRRAEARLGGKPPQTKVNARMLNERSEASIVNGGEAPDVSTFLLSLVSLVYVFVIVLHLP